MQAPNNRSGQNISETENSSIKKMLEKSVLGDNYLPVGQYLKSVLEIAGSEIQK
jgi:hypothetical protein